MHILRYLVSAVLILHFEVLFAHSVHPDLEGEDEALKEVDQETLSQVFESINKEYTETVGPIFRQKCYDCHSENINLPWYSALPGIGQAIERDIHEAREHIDFTGGFPFQGHGGPIADLREIQHVLETSSMPPRLYRVMNRGSSLTSEEKSKILSWIDMSIEKIDEVQGNQADQ